jgi:hypothetical protein
VPMHPGFNRFHLLLQLEQALKCDPDLEVDLRAWTDSTPVTRLATIRLVR